MELVYSLFFWIIAFSLIVSALGMVFSKSIVHSAISLIVAFLSIAGIFILLNADFVAISQIIIYAVGITIILIFAIMLTSKKSDEKLWIAIAPRSFFALIISFCLFGLISFSVTSGFKQMSENTGIFSVKPPSSAAVEVIKKEGTSGIIGKALFTKYILPFEVLSILLLAVILGSVVLAKATPDSQNP
ncbi:MAG: NADH-quinone oxidoreductase subunit J [bacterium]